MNRLYKKTEDGRYVRDGEVVGLTKTEAGNREVFPAEIVFKVLKEWQTYCAEKNIVSQYVFPNSKTKGILTYSAFHNSLARFLKKYGLDGEKIHLYTFRHTYATVSMEQGISAVIAANNMGHAKPSLVQDCYTQVTDDAVKEKAAQQMDGDSQKYFP